MTHAEYCRYAMDNHARLVLGTEPVARHLLAYVQQHVYDGCYRPDAPAWRFDSVSHITTASPEDLAAATSTPEYKELIAPDEEKFADQRSPLFLMFEEKALPLAVRGASKFRLLHYLRARPGVLTADLIASWAGVHERSLREAPQLFSGVRRAVLNASMSPPGAPSPSYTGMCEIGFLQGSDAAAMSEYVERVEDGLDALIERSAGFYLLAEAVPVRGSIY